MKAEIISLGTEIILGQIVNTNAQFLAAHLKELGIEANWQTTTDDEPSRIQAAIKQAQTRAQLIFICGGIGPTLDDQTKASTAKTLGVDLALDENQWQKIKADFAFRNVNMTPENIQMAYYLAGGVPLANPTGMALGSYLTQGEHTYVILPGPPREFKAMVTQSLLPLLEQQFNLQTVIVNKTLHFLGLPESQLMDEIQDSLIQAGITDVLATSYVQNTEILVKLTIRNVKSTEAKQRLEQAQAVILKQVGHYCFGVGEDIDLAVEVVKLLKRHQLKITAAESLTGGMFQSTLCGVSGASNVFDGGFVTYAATAKANLIGVPKETIAQYGVVSSQTAKAMAEGCRNQMDADLGISFTGVAGPEQLENHPAGTVWIGLAMKGKPTQTYLLQLPPTLATRQYTRQRSVAMGLMYLYWALQDLTN